jgi:DNA polymerase I
MRSTLVRTLTAFFGGGSIPESVVMENLRITSHPAFLLFALLEPTMVKHAAKNQKSLFDQPAEGASEEEVGTAPAAGLIGAASPCPDSQGSATADAPDSRHAVAATSQTSMASAPPPESLAGQTVWVVDAHSLIHQVFHAIPDMTSPTGQPVNAVYGFTRDLLFLLESKQPDFLFCAFDLPGKTFRHALYEQYKAGRPEMHEDLVPQIGFVHRMVEALGIPLLAHEGYEADDIVATIARLTDALGGHCFIVSGDKDCRQLITDRVKLYNIRKNEVIDRQILRQEWGVAPNQVVDYQALVGDSTDNVPGVPLIGPKAARDLLEKYGTLERILEHVDEVGGTAKRENLKKYREQALLSRRLVELDTHVPVAVSWKSARPDGVDLVRAGALFEEFGFRRLADRLRTISGAGAQTGDDAPAGKPVYRTIDTPEALDALLIEMRRQKQVSVDTETTHIWPRWAEIVGISLSWDEQHAYYLPLRGPAGSRLLDPQKTLDALRPLLEDPATGKLGQNLKYDRIVLRGAGVELAGPPFDTMVASYLLDAGQRNHNLDDLAKRYLRHVTIKIEELIGSGKHQKRMDEVPVPQITDYAAEDALVPVRLQPILARRMDEESLAALFRDVEMPLIDVLVELEYNGVKIDVQRLGELSREFGEQMQRLEQEIYSLAGREFNIASPRQLQEILFVEHKLPVIKRTAKTGPSTDVDVLEELALRHPLPAKIVDYRQYAKLKGTYVDALPQMVNPRTGRVHASFNQVVTATGRLSAHDPNLQNIPVRTKAGRAIRSAFVPGEEGWTLVAADYSQIELRVLAHYTADERLCDAFQRDEDIHARVAGQVNNVPLEQVTDDMRRQAKVVNFGTIYGQGAVGLSRQLGIDRETASKFINSYFQTYPGIERFLIESLAECRRLGYVTTILGRRRAIEGVRADAGRSRNLAERTAVNTVIQGSAADLMKLAMIHVYQRLKREKHPARMLLQIHDELIFEAPAAEVGYLSELLREEMSGVYPLRVPLKVDVKSGPNWADTR